MSQYNEHDPHDTGADKASFNEQAERFSRRFSDSAQQIWLAGLGAFGRAQAEGSRFFEGLVKEGQAWEERRREKEAAEGPNWRDNVEQHLGDARQKAAGTWGKVEKAFDDQVQGVLRSMHVPTAEDVAALHARIDALTTRLEQLERPASHPAADAPPPGSHQAPGAPP